MAEEVNLVLIKPESDNQLMAFYNEAVSLRQYAEVRVIKIMAGNISSKEVSYVIEVQGKFPAFFDVSQSVSRAVVSIHGIQEIFLKFIKCN